MASRGIPFWEFQERVRLGRFRANAVTGMWNWLALTFCVVKAKGSAPADCQLPFSDIINLTSDKVREFTGVGPARLAVYELFHKSLVVRPDPLPDSREITCESFTRFTKGSCNTAGQIWNTFIRAAVPGFDNKPSMGRLEAYCESLRISKRFPVHYKLLSQWLVHLKQHR